MTGTSYSACATRPEERFRCDALKVGKYPDEYSRRVDEISANIEDLSFKAKVRQTLGFFGRSSSGNLNQSSPYSLVVLQQFLPTGKILATTQRLQFAKENTPDFMSGFYVDCGLNLVPFERLGLDMIANPIQAELLESDLRIVGINMKRAKLISYHILTHEVNNRSPSGLVFRLSEEGRDIAEDVILNTNDFAWNYKPTTGGLFRAYLCNDGTWSCAGKDIGGLHKDGRVVVEYAEAGAKK